MDPTIPGVYLFDEFELDAARRRLTRAGETVVLNQRAIELLIALVERRGTVVSKDQLFEIVWKGQIVEENNLTVHVAALRKALGEKKGEHRFIVTVPGEGYKFVGELKAPEETAIVIENRTIERIMVSDDVVAKKRRIWPAIAVACILMILAGSAAAYFISIRVAEQKRVAARGNISTVIVLPMYSNYSLAEDWEVMRGLAEGVSYSLARLDDLRVYSPQAFTKFKDAQSVVEQVGRDLGVDAVVICDFRRQDNQVVADTSIVSARDGSLLWGQQFTRPAAEIASLKDDIAAAVGRVLRPSSRVATTTRIPRGEAYEYAMKGRASWSRRAKDELKRAAEFYLKAIEADPQYAAAYAGLAETYVLYSSYDVASSKDSMPQAKAAALKALELDDTLAEAHTALGFYLNYYEWDRAGAEREFRRAIELNPNYATAHQWLGSDCLVNVKRFDEAIASLKRAEELDPLSSVAMKDRGAALLYARRPDEALPILLKVVSLDPRFGVGHGNLALAFYAKGMFAEAVAANRHVMELGPNPISKGYLALSLVKSGDRVGARKLHDELVADAAVNFVPDYARALSSLAIGDRDAALDFLEKESEARGYWAGMYAVAPELDDLRNEPRFKALLKRMNLPE